MERKDIQCCVLERGVLEWTWAMGTVEGNMRSNVINIQWLGVKWSGAKWDGFEKRTAGHIISFVELCVKVNRRKDGCSVDYHKTSLQFTHTFNSRSHQTNLISYLFELQRKRNSLSCESVVCKFTIIVHTITIQFLLEQRDMQLCLIVQFVPAMCGKNSQGIICYVCVLIHLIEGAYSLSQVVSKPWIHNFPLF